MQGALHLTCIRLSFSREKFRIGNHPSVTGACTLFVILFVPFMLVKKQLVYISALGVAFASLMYRLYFLLFFSFYGSGVFWIYLKYNASIETAVDVQYSTAWLITYSLFIHLNFLREATKRHRLSSAMHTVCHRSHAPRLLCIHMYLYIVFTMNSHRTQRRRAHRQKRFHTVRAVTRCNCSHRYTRIIATRSEAAADLGS